MAVVCGSSPSARRPSTTNSRGRAARRCCSRFKLALHLRASRNTGVTQQELAELLLHSSVYAGVPAANAAIRIAKAVLSD
ncbi:MAG TPA: carboxymuconolactone decarboxylase family protein [Myxococcota bacterium]|nr:carboxymuconolactone decarboxylase family protein [Myxococcota bacterium]